ncbi:MAG: hypothetical protein Pg6C_07880 [Treponemataceae bacterium]|nr:MAG: hypothetical protein Pg6C_07880 [Treponemataceae bacterium]
MFRLFVERKEEFALEARRLRDELSGFLGIGGIKNLRVVNRYEIRNIDKTTFELSKTRIFSEPQSDVCCEKIVHNAGDTVIAYEYLPAKLIRQQ